MKPVFHVRWFVSPLHDAHGTSSLVAGLGSLARSGQVQLTLEPLESTDVQPHVMHLDARELNSGQVRRFAVEVFDRPDRFDLGTLRGVDVYFKQTLDRQYLADLPVEFQHRIQAAGLTFSTRTAGSNSLMARSAVTACLAHAQSYGMQSMPTAVKRMTRDVLDIASRLEIGQWERTAADPVLHDVVFQTRLWRPLTDSATGRRRINGERVQVVRALREAFGGSDRVGLIHTDFAAEQAPDALLTRKVSRSEYARQLRTSLISVNTDGLDGSPGFKLAESLAAGAAIVSQPLQFELPAPFQPEVNYLPFDTAEACVRQCRRLIDDGELAARIRSENLRYYERYVRPEALAGNILERAFA
jgi:hypothetical protein